MITYAMERSNFLYASVRLEIIQNQFFNNQSRSRLCFFLTLERLLSSKWPQPTLRRRNHYKALRHSGARWWLHQKALWSRECGACEGWKSIWWSLRNYWRVKFRAVMFFAGGDRNCDHVRGGHIIKLRFGAAIVVFMFIVIVFWHRCTFFRSRLL